MPRAKSNRGGHREGTPGRAYSNRTDLNTPRVPIMSAPSQQYGQRAAQERAQRAVPMAPQPSPVIPQTPALTAPTARPDEPVTAGADFGPGPDSTALALGAHTIDLAARLRALYATHPNDDLRAVIEELEG